MTARTHDAFAFASLITVGVLFPPASINLATLASAVIANNIGALLPDVDEAGNRLYSLLPGDNQTGRQLRKLFYGHRTITHSLIGLFFVYKIIGWIAFRLLNPAYIDANIVLTSFMIGYISHLVSDGLTKEGLPLLFPIKWNIGFPPIAMLRIRTGTWQEFWIILPAVGVFIMWFIWAHQNEIFNFLKLIH